MTQCKEEQRRFLKVKYNSHNFVRYVFNLPGPFAPPGNRRPKRNMTALSYSWTTYIGEYKALYVVGIHATDVSTK